MTSTSVIAVLPVGEFGTEAIKFEFEAILQAFRSPGSELVIADPVADEDRARQSVADLSKRDPDLLLIIPLRGLSAQVIETAALSTNVPKLICPVQGKFALPSSTLAIGALRQALVPVEMVYAPADQPGFAVRCLGIVNAAKAFTRLRKSRIGVVGGLFPNLVSCRYDPQAIHSRLGVSLFPISFDSIRNSIQSLANPNQAVEQKHAEIASLYQVGSADSQALNAGIKLHLALKQFALEQKLDGFATECWSAFPRELGLNPCLGFVEEDYALACEGDVLLCISLLIVRNLSSTRAYVGDLFELDLDGILTLTHCGAPASLACSKEAVVLGRSQLALERGFETMTCRPKLKEGPVTIFRFYGEGYDQLHLASGNLLNCEQSPNLAVSIRINADRWDFLDQCFGNHYLVVAGDIRRELKLLCKWLGITIFET